MSRIDDIAQILKENTSESIQVTDNFNIFDFDGSDYAIVLTPSNSVLGEIYSDIDIFTVTIYAPTKATLTSKKADILKCKSLYPTGYSHSTRIYFIVDDATGFAVDDSISSGANTGTCYKVDGSTLYLKEVSGTFATGNTISNGTATATLTTNSTNLPFPFYLDVEPVIYGLKWIQLQIIARWVL